MWPGHIPYSLQPKKPPPMDPSACHSSHACSGRECGAASKFQPSIWISGSELLHQILHDRFPWPTIPAAECLTIKINTALSPPHASLCGPRNKGITKVAAPGGRGCPSHAARQHLLVHSLSCRSLHLFVITNPCTPSTRTFQTASLLKTSPSQNFPFSKCRIIACACSRLTAPQTDSAPCSNKLTEAPVTVAPGTCSHFGDHLREVFIWLYVARVAWPVDP